MTARHRVITATQAVGESVSVFVRDVGYGLLAVSHNMLALLGLVVVAGALFGVGRADLRLAAEQRVYDWLQERQDARAEAEDDSSLAGVTEPDAVARATAADPSDLPRQQAAVAKWLSRRYRVAPEPVSRLVQEAWAAGQRAGLDPTLILAVMAVESSFNPFAQSQVGAQGLMQVMTRVHDDKYEAFGGQLAAFDPVTNVRVGVQVLKECITRAGSLEAGLRFYVGAANRDDDGGYALKVLAEQARLRRLVEGKSVPVNTPLNVAAPIHAAPPSAPKATPAEEARHDQVALLQR
jgi:hypothetical protein